MAAYLTACVLQPHIKTWNVKLLAFSLSALCPDCTAANSRWCCTDQVVARLDSWQRFRQHAVPNKTAACSAMQPQAIQQHFVNVLANGISTADIL